jgi:AcrR family transcriptional regulator
VPRAGLSAAAVTEAGAALADEIGFAQLSMGLVAERLGVKTPSLYKHVASQAELSHRIGVLAVDELADRLRDALQGRAGRDALTAGAQAMRAYVQEHPGRHAAGEAARATGPDDPLLPAVERVLASWTAMVRGYALPPREEVHALRMLRSVLTGFATSEAAGGFQIDAPVDESFAWTVDFLDHGLRAVAGADQARAARS